MTTRDDWRKRKFSVDTEKPTPLTPEDLPSMSAFAWRKIWKAAITREERRERPAEVGILRVEAINYLIKTEE